MEGKNPVFNHFQYIGTLHIRGKIKLHDDLYAVLMGILYHVLKFFRRTVRSGIRHLRSKVIASFITPVINPGRLVLLFRQIHIVIPGLIHASFPALLLFQLQELIGGHQLHCGNPQLLQIRKLFRNSRIGTSVLHTGRRMACKASGMNQVQNGIRQRSHQRSVILPVIAMPAHTAAKPGLRLPAPAFISVYHPGIGICNNILSGIEIILELYIGKPFQLHAVNIAHTVLIRKRKMQRLTCRMQI